MKKRLITTVVAVALVISLMPLSLPALADTGWYDLAWQYRREITIDHTKVSDVTDPSTTYANFPVLVYATELSNIKANGADIRFTSSDGTTELPREIESYSGGTLYAWVKVTLTKDSSDSSDDVIYMYYGNDSASEPAPDSACGAQNVWASNYVMVQHLQEDPTDPNPVFKDSTANDNDGINWGSMTPSDQVIGQVDGSIDFDGINDRINLGNIGTLSNDTFSISVWVKVTNASPRQEMVWGAVTDTSDERFRFEVYDTWINFHDVYNVDTWTSSGTIEADNWYHVVATYDYPNQKASIYLNGEFKASDTSFSQASNTLGALQIGSRDGACYVNGIIDEVRISDTARSSDWIKASYNNQNSPSTFCSVGSEEEPPNSNPAVDTSAIYEADHSTQVTAMTPQIEYAVKVTVSDADSLSDLSTVKVTIFYDSDGDNDSADVPSSGDTQTAAILTCNVGATPSWQIDPNTNTTWGLVSASCVQPTLSNTTGDFWFHFKPGKVATEATDWDAYAVADDGGTPGTLYDASGYDMNWYGEITVNTAGVDWGTVGLGSGFTDDTTNRVTVSVTYIYNGNYNKQVKASSPWGSSPTVTLNPSGTPGAGEFSLKADDNLTLDSAVLVSTTYATFGTGTQTDESGVTEVNNGIWLKTGPSGIEGGVDYDGTIYYAITQ